MQGELNIYKQTARMLAFTLLAIAACRFTAGYFAPLFVLAGVYCAFANKLGWALVYFVLMPFFVILNPGVLPKENAVVGYSLRFGPLLIGLILALRGYGRRGRHRLPFGMLFLFLVAAALSSIDGWAPKVSYMKLVNFIFFLFGIWFGTQNLQHRPQDVFILRGFMLAISALLVFGSIALIPFPSISYATSLGYALREGGAEFANDVFQQMKADSMRVLFCGITNQSQALAPLLSSVCGWTMCDMLFMEQKFRKPHLVLLVAALPLLYMTRSRVALVTGTFTMVVIAFYTAQKVQLPVLVRQNIRKGISVGMVLLVLGAVVAQLRGGLMSEWLRKNNTGGADRRSLTEALTESRMGLMEYSLYEFRRNPLLGSGFQVAEYTRDQTKDAKGLVISASIEKGVLPVMVLGETGILGSIFFLLFLATFFFVCTQRQYHVTVTMFAILLMTNMGEATFFSPGGIGGILWMICVVGGFTLDTTILYRKSILRQWAEMAAAEEEMRLRQDPRRAGIGL